MPAFHAGKGVTIKLARNDPTRPPKGWHTNLAQPGLPSIGYANRGIDERHLHRELCEVYLVARGSSTLVIDRQSITLHAGDVIVVEPGEVHTFVASTPDYFHFVLHCPPAPGDKVIMP